MDWQNGTVEGNILTFTDVNAPVTYTYDCGNGKMAVFSLYVSDEAPEPTLEPTPEPTPEPTSTSELGYTVTFHRNDESGEIFATIEDVPSGALI